MANVLALIPARVGSKSIPRKNWTLLAGTTPYERAFQTALGAGVDTIVTSTDLLVTFEDMKRWQRPISRVVVTPWLYCEPPLHTDTCPMIDVVKDALNRIPGPLDQIVVLLQPTQPLREPKHIQAAITLLQESQADSVVSVTPIPKTHNPEWQYIVLQTGGLATWPGSLGGVGVANRHELSQTYVRDGTVYAFYRRTVLDHGNIYGEQVLPLIIPPEETCPLDTPEDWAEAERRLRAREQLVERL